MALKILLADDSMIAQNMGKKILTDAGYDVIGVSNGAAAVKKLAEGIPDIVLLDVYMPGYSGLEVCERIKNSPATAHVPVLLTVGKLEPFRAEEGMKVKADGVIVKPFEATDLMTVVAKLAERVGGKQSPQPVRVAPPPAAPVQAEPAVKVDRTGTRIEVPADIAAAPAFMTEELTAPPKLEQAPRARAAIASAVAKPAGSAMPAFDLNEAATSPGAPAVIPIVALEPGQMASPDQVQNSEGLAPQLELSTAPILPDVEIPNVPDLEPTILQKRVEVEVAPDPALIGNALDTAALPAEEEAAPELRIEAGVEEPEFAIIEDESDQAEEVIEAAMRAADTDSIAAAHVAARQSVPAGSERQPPAPLEIHLESVPSPATPAAPYSASAPTASPARATRMSEPVPPTPPAPLGQTSLDDHIDRALHAVLASMNGEPQIAPAEEVPRSLDDLDEALEAAPQQALEDFDAKEEPPEIEVPSKQGRIDIGFGPDIGDAKEVVVDQAAAAVPLVVFEPKPSAAKAAAMAGPEPMNAAAAASPMPHRPVALEGVAATPQESTLVPKPPKQTTPEPSVSAQPTEAVRAVENALAAVNETIAEQVVDRVLQRVRRELIEDLKRLLKDT